MHKLSNLSNLSTCINYRIYRQPRSASGVSEGFLRLPRSASGVSEGFLRLSRSASGVSEGFLRLPRSASGVSNGVYVGFSWIDLFETNFRCPSRFIPPNWPQNGPQNGSFWPPNWPPNWPPKWPQMDLACPHLAYLAIQQAEICPSNVLIQPYLVLVIS